MLAIQKVDDAVIVTVGGRVVWTGTISEFSLTLAKASVRATVTTAKDD